MIDENYFEFIDSVEKAYLLSLVLLNMKDTYNGKYLKVQLKISDIKKGNSYLNYSFYNKCEAYEKKNYPYFQNIDNIYNKLKLLGDIYISDSNYFELYISSKKIVDDIIKQVGFESLELLLDQDLSVFIKKLNNYNNQFTNQFIKAYFEQFAKIIGESLYVNIYNYKNYEVISEIYKIPFIIKKECIGYTIEYRNSDMLDILGKIYDHNYLFINYDLFNFNNYDILPKIRIFKTSDNAIMPCKASYSDAGYDLTIIKEHKKLNSDTMLYDTGIKMNIPNGYYVEIVPRSSISKSGYMLANNIGIIDQSYRGNLYVALRKVNNDCNNIELPWKCCQLIVRKQIYSNMVLSSDDFNITNRGDGAFGSTG
tara:strand:+ start:11024 stop:12124 length:1101 start_codon:yes stop_codon:yes gene_type:complete